MRIYMATYKDAIDWIADMDDTSWVPKDLKKLKLMKEDDLRPSVTATMVSHIWNKDILTVTHDIYKSMKITCKR